MGCTTILIGKNASYDGSTIIARTEDSPNGVFKPKKFIVVEPKDQPRHYKAVSSKFEIELPDNPMRYTSVPNAIYEIEGTWGQSGFNEVNVSMSATETITSNPRVLGADPLVKDGFGEEDMYTIVLPYIKTAREGVERLGKLLKEYGTYEYNAVAFSDENEIWWLETIGGHHWIARKVPDDCYVTAPNQFGLDYFEFDNEDEFMCSEDLQEFIKKHNLDLNFDGESFNPRYAFGSQRDSDRVYNTPRAWYMQKVLNPEIEQSPISFFIPWCRKPYRKIAIEDIKYVLSSHYQFTEFDPLDPANDEFDKRTFRTIGINRHSHLGILQARPNGNKLSSCLEWITFSSMPYTAPAPFFTQVSKTPEYFSNTTKEITTDSVYWTNRIIAAIADAHFKLCEPDIDTFIQNVMAYGYKVIGEVDSLGDKVTQADLEKANQKMADYYKEQNQILLDKVLYIVSNRMHNRFQLSD